MAKVIFKKSEILHTYNEILEKLTIQLELFKLLY